MLELWPSLAHEDAVCIAHCSTSVPGSAPMADELPMHLWEGTQYRDESYIAEIQIFLPFIAMLVISKGKYISCLHHTHYFSFI